MPHALKFLLSSQAAVQRMQHRAPAYTIHVELVGGKGFEELDCSGYDHALNFAQSVIDHWNSAVSVAIRRVSPNGILGKTERILDFRDKTPTPESIALRMARGELEQGVAQ